MRTRSAQPEYLLRRTEVAYVGQTKSVRANAAGGKYRGRMGRLLFKTDTLFQHVLSEQSVAVNVIKFKLFGLFSGSAVLPGVWRQKSGNSIAVQFQPPRLAIGPLNLRFGPTSEVTLNVTYLDENLRICRGGSSGVPFVFRADTCRDGASLEAASKSWEAVVAQKPLGKPPVVAALLVAALGCLRSALCSSAGVSRTMARVGALALPPVLPSSFAPPVASSRTRRVHAPPVMPQLPLIDARLSLLFPYSCTAPAVATSTVEL